MGLKLDFEIYPEPLSLKFISEVYLKAMDLKLVFEVDNEYLGLKFISYVYPKHAGLRLISEVYQCWEIPYHILHGGLFLYLVTHCVHSNSSMNPFPLFSIKAHTSMNIHTHTTHAHIFTE